jgi:hypothetical protein
VILLHIESGATTQTVTNAMGRWVASNLPSGRVRITARSLGFRTYVREVSYDANRPMSYALALQIGGVSETVTVEAAPRNEIQNLPIELRENEQQFAVHVPSADFDALDLQGPYRVEIQRAVRHGLDG